VFNYLHVSEVVLHLQGGNVVLQHIKTISLRNPHPSFPKFRPSPHLTRPKLLHWNLHQTHSRPYLTSLVSTEFIPTADRRILLMSYTPYQILLGLRTSLRMSPVLQHRDHGFHLLGLHWRQSQGLRLNLHLSQTCQPFISCRGSIALRTPSLTLSSIA
jgi:hypothetical protein